jgi:hypothetical protein
MIWWERWGRGSDRGQASLACVGAVLAAVLAVGSTLVAADQQGLLVAYNTKCAVTKLVTAGQGTCTPMGGQPGDPVDPDDSGGEPGQLPKTCADVIYADSTRSGSTHSNASEFSRQLRVNCIWYPINGPCVAQEPMGDLAEVAGGRLARSPEPGVHRPPVVHLELLRQERDRLFRQAGHRHREVGDHAAVLPQDRGEQRCDGRAVGRSARTGRSTRTRTATTRARRTPTGTTDVNAPVTAV